MYRLVRPFIFALGAEQAHDAATALAANLRHLKIALPLLRNIYSYSHPCLEIDLLGTPFSNPIGLAAGFDKNARLVEAIAALGFGFMEVGSATNAASIGNPQPRMFRLPADQALINRLGLNNDGATEIAGRLSELKSRGVDFPFAVNIAKTNNQELTGTAAIDDFAECFSTLAPYGCFTVLNISCPNTEDGRSFETSLGYHELFAEISARRAMLSRQNPVLVKLSPDTGDIQVLRIIDSAIESGFNGFVLSNTTSSRDGLLSSESAVKACGAGGLSGPPLYERTLARVRLVFGHLNKSGLSGSHKIVAVGGVSDAAGAYKLLKAGASLIELYTALVYRGPSLVSQICRELAALLQTEGVSKISQIIGIEES